MEPNTSVARLFRDAAAYRLVDFHRLAERVIREGAADGLVDAYLLRAQVGLYAADESMTQDLEAASRLGAALALPCLFDTWAPGSPNGFVVFDGRGGALERLGDGLTKAGQLLGAWYDAGGAGMVRQIESEICYFTGRFEKGAALAQAQYGAFWDNPAHAIRAAYVLLRCYMALGETANVETVLLDIIKLARQNADNPAFPGIYGTIREWVNYTTGWSGDTPRYHHTPSGSVLPVLEDRADAIQHGVAELGPTEAPFLEYARLRYENPVTVRSLYMGVFHALSHFRAGQPEQAEAVFRQAYDVSVNSGFISAFVEFGGQVLPLLDYLRFAGRGYEADWLNRTADMAKRYEQSILEFRGV